MIYLFLTFGWLKSKKDELCLLPEAPLFKPLRHQTAWFVVKPGLSALDLRLCCWIGIHLYMFKMSPSMPLQVLVLDGGPTPRQSTVWVMVQILDENDNKPTFPEKVYQVKLPERERRKKGEPIYRVFAYDRDEGPNSDLSYSIVDGNEEGKFFIDPKTAVVSSRKAFTAGSYDILTVCIPLLIIRHAFQHL